MHGQAQAAEAVAVENFFSVDELQDVIGTSDFDTPPEIRAAERYWNRQVSSGRLKGISATINQATVQKLYVISYTIAAKNYHEPACRDSGYYGS